MKKLTKCYRKWRRVRIGSVVLMAMLIGTILWAQDIFAADPSLYLHCEGNLRSETGIGATSVTDVGYGSGPSGMGQAVEFRNRGSAVFSSPGIWSPSQGTFAAWIKPRGDFNSDMQRHDIFSVGGDFGFFFSWIGKASREGGNVPGSLMFVTNPNGTDSGWVSATASIGSIFGNNGWHHVAITWGSGGKKIYVDGDLVASAGYTRINRNLSPLYLGRSQHFGTDELFHVNSWMDEVLFYTSQLSNNQIRDLFGGEVDMAPQGSITGRVSNSSGSGLPNITVTATPGNYVAVTSSGGIFNPGAGGSYTLNLPAGTYQVSYSGSGYRTACYSNVIVGEGETITLDMALNSGSGADTCISLGVPAPPPPPSPDAEDEPEEESPTPTGDMCSEGNPLYFYFVQSPTTMTMLSLTNPCDEETADISATWYIGEGAESAGYESGISVPPLGNLMGTTGNLSPGAAGTEGWMIVKSNNTALFGNQSICDTGNIRTVLDLPSFTPRDRWAMLYFTSLPGWTTKISIFNPGDTGLANISIKAYDNDGNLLETSPVTTLPAKYQVIRSAGDFFNGADIGDGWIEINSPDGRILAFGCTGGS